MGNRDSYSGRFVPKSVKELFWDKIYKTETCWLWTGALTKAGYGRAWEGKKAWKAHRLSWTLHTGEILKGLGVLHHCDNPPCVNPDHLFLGDHTVNMKDKFDKGRNCYGDSNGSRTHPERRPRGDLSPVAVVTDERARTIYDLYHNDLSIGYYGRTYTQTKLASTFKVSQETISLIVRAEGRYVWLG